VSDCQEKEKRRVDSEEASLAEVFFSFWCELLLPVIQNNLLQYFFSLAFVRNNATKKYSPRSITASSHETRRENVRSAELNQEKFTMILSIYFLFHLFLPLCVCVYMHVEIYIHP